MNNDIHIRNLINYFNSVGLDFIIGNNTFTFYENETIKMHHLTYIIDYLTLNYLTFNIISSNNCLQILILSKN